MDDVNIGGGTANVVAGTNEDKTTDERGTNLERTDNVSNITDAAEISKGKTGKPGRKGRGPMPAGSVTPAPQDKTETSGRAPKMGSLVTIVIDGFNQANNTLMPPPRVKMAVYMPIQGPKQIIEILEDNICVHRTLQYLTDEIAVYVSEYARERRIDYFEWESKDEKSCAKSWVSRARPIPQPLPMLYKSDRDNLGFARLHFDLKLYENLDNAPVSKELVSRFKTNKIPGLCWIGSLFYPGSYREQFLLVIGQGRDGKGSLMSVISRVLGAAAVSYDDLPQDTFWAQNMDNKRGVFFPDLQNVKMINGARFKALTGGDPIWVRPLFAPGYQVTLTSKVWINTNVGRLPFSSQRHSTERPLIVEMEPPSISTNDLTDDYKSKLLWDEAEFLVGYCCYLYEKHVVHGKRCAPDKKGLAALNEMVSANEDEWEALANRHFRFGKGLMMAPSGYQQILTNLFGIGTKNPDKMKFSDFIKRRYGVRKTSSRIAGGAYPESVWGGICAKFGAEYDPVPPDNCVAPDRCIGKMDCRGPAKCPNRK